jgi:hypothetical protein
MRMPGGLPHTVACAIGRAGTAAENHHRPKADAVITILLIILVLLLLFGGFGYSRRGRRL